MIYISCKIWTERSFTCIFHAGSISTHHFYARQRIVNIRVFLLVSLYPRYPIGISLYNTKHHMNVVASRAMSFFFTISYSPESKNLVYFNIEIKKVIEAKKVQVQINTSYREISRFSGTFFVRNHADRRRIFFGEK